MLHSDADDPALNEIGDVSAIVAAAGVAMVSR
jgi:hypothetical protein